MAKIKPVSVKKKRSGPQSPGTIPCLLMVVLIFLVLGFILYYSIARAT
jgi:hypothetical protein